MGWCFDRGGLAPLFADAPPRSSIPGKTKVSCCGRGKYGAASHFSKVRSGAIQRTFAEGEGRSQVTDYMEQNTPTVGLCCGWTTGTTNSLPQILTRMTKA